MPSRHPPIPVAEPDVGPLEEKYLLEAYRSGWISSLGPFLPRFEKSFAELCDAKYAVAVSNGTVALHLALVACGVGPGDEVIVPALTFVATAATVRHAGAEPVFVDSEPETGVIDPSAVARAIGPKTKAIVVVHLYGHPADMDPLTALARERGIPLIEDAAEAHGARYKGRRVGAIGDLGVFSFYGNKIVTTGEGGMIVTQRQELADKIRFLKDHAMDPKRRYWHPEVGFNYRMTNLQAAIGCAQLERFDEIVSKRRRILETYREAARASSGRALSFNPAREWAEPVPWLVCALLPAGTSSNDRDAAIARLREAGIDSRPYFHLLSEMPPYATCKTVSARGDALSCAKELSSRGLNVPTVSAATREIADEIVACLTRS
jgi:perosamine synthetase